MIRGGLFGSCPKQLLKNSWTLALKQSRGRSSIRPGYSIRLLLNLPEFRPGGREGGDILFSLHSEAEGLSESRASSHGWETVDPRGQRPKCHHASSKPLSRRKSVIEVL